MTLENLVPPFERCKQIPEGCFEDSALVWRLENSTFPDKPEYYHVYLRGTGESMLHVFPAPTLAEIMAVCPDCYARRYRRLKPPWAVIFLRKYGHVEKLASDEANPATAALKLWLEVDRMETDFTDGTNLRRGTADGCGAARNGQRGR